MMRAWRGWVRGSLGAAIGLVLLVGCTGEIDEPTSIGSRHDPLEGDPTEEQCGFDVVSPPAGVPVDACLSGQGVTTIFGPEAFVRETGTPGELTRTFEVPEEGSLCVRVVNHGMASARLAVDGEDIITPDAFNPNVPEVTASPELTPGEHALDIEVASKPGTSIAVEIRFVVPPQPQAELILGEEGFVGLYNVYDDPDPFSPAGTEGLPTTTTFGVTGTALRTPGASSGKYEFRLRATFEVADGWYCQPALTLTAEAIVQDGARETLRVVWDGRDANGILVAEGIHYYRAVVEVVRRRISDGGEEVLDFAVGEIQTVEVSDSFGLAGKTTRELEQLIGPLKASAPNYYDLGLQERRYFDALARARALRRSQLPVEDRFMPVPHHSGPRYYALKAARPVFVREGQPVYSTGPKLFWTRNEDGTAYGRDQGLYPADPAMVVVDEPTGEARYSDDCHSSTLSPCVVFPETYDGPFTIIVFAAPSNSGHFGRADVVINGQVITEQAEFGGVFIPLGRLPDGTYAFHTVHIPNGADDTGLFLFDADWNLKAMDRDSGPDSAAKIVDSIHFGDRLLVDAWAPSTKGYADVVINDCTGDPDTAWAGARSCCVGAMDSDRDCLSDELEEEIGTYKDTDVDADPPRLGHDTDGDGVFDYFEVIGRRTPDGSSQGLRWLGADPRRKDLFVEFDQQGDAEFVDESGARAMANVYEDLPGVANLEGDSGIAIHVDTGIPCGVGTLCGDWGGTQILAEPAGYAKKRSLIAASGNFASARQGVFHYGYITEAGSGQSCGYSCASFYAGAKLQWAAHEVAAHELGHNLGLAHWGDPSKPEFNHASAYPSVMNYAFSYRLEGASQFSRFSEGNMDPIDYRALHELGYSSGVDKTYLGGSPYFYALIEDQDECGAGTEACVDFNNDGRPSSTPVTYDPSHCFDTSVSMDYVSVRYGGRGWPDLHDAHSLSSATPSGGGAIAIVPITPDGLEATVWVFFPMFNAGQTFPHYTKMSNVVGQTQEWTPLAPLGHFDGRAKGDVAASSLVFQGQGLRVLVVYPHEDGSLWYSLFDPAYPGSAVWSPIPYWPSETTAVQATVTAIQGGLVVMYRDVAAPVHADNVYMTILDNRGRWSTAWERLEGIWSSSTPGIAEGPDGRMYVAYVDSSHIRMASMDPYDVNSLEPITLFVNHGMDMSALGWESIPRLNVAFVPYLHEGHTPFSDGSGYFAVFWNTGSPASPDHWFDMRAYTPGYVSPAGPSFISGAMRRRADGSGWGTIPKAWPSYSLGIAVRFNDVVEVYAGQTSKSGTLDSIFYLPFANGTAPYAPVSVLNVDHDDNGTITRTLCKSIWQFVHGSKSECFCETLDPDACPALPEESPEEVVCAVFGTSP